MDFSLICVILAFIIYVIYNIFALSLFGVPNSLSNTYYFFMNKKKWMSYFFPIMMVLITFLLLPGWLEISNGSNYQFMAFLAAAGIMFVGASPKFKNSKLEDIVHTVSAVFAAIFALLWVILVANRFDLIVLYFILILIFAIMTKTVWYAKVYWLETVAFFSTFNAIIMYYLYNGVIFI